MLSTWQLPLTTFKIQIMSKISQLNLRVESELKKKLKKLAQADKRSLNSKCEMMLEEQIKIENSKKLKL